MKLPVATIFLLLVSLGATTVQAQDKLCSLTLSFTNLLERKGTIRVGLATDAANFMGKAAIDTAVTVPATGTLTITFANLPAGTYAVRSYQDVNDNGKLDQENGRPAEPFGFSNLAMLMEPPSFDQTSFRLTQTTEKRIVLLSL